MLETQSSPDQITHTCQTLISEHQNLRNKFNLPDPYLIFSNSYVDYRQQRLNYFNKIRSVSESCGLTFYKYPIFFQQHPNLGVFYLPKQEAIVINQEKVGTLIEPLSGRKYDQGELLMDLTQEVTRGLIHQSNPEISNKDLARQSVISICFPERVTPNFVTKTFPSLVQENLQIHEQITA